MRKFYLFAILFIASSNFVFSQNVNVSGGLVGNGTYATLGAAFTAINGGAQTGSTIVVSIVANTTEASSAILNANNWATLTVSPSGGASRTISGNIAGHMIDLNGADNVTIDGLSSGGNSLSIDNTNGGSSTSTIRFVNDATNNVVNRTLVKGSAGNTLGTGFGVIYFATGITTGNDNNTISLSDIAASSSGTPLNAIYSFGTSAAIDNSNNTINFCFIYDFFSATAASSGININSNNSSWTITNNSFYQTATRTATSANTHNAIVVTSGNGYSIANNIIGGGNSSGGGTAWTLSGTIASRFIGINVTSSVGTATTIQNNAITNFALNTSSGAATVNGIWCGISANGGGTFNIGTTIGNLIGATSGTGSIIATSTNAGGLLVGINSTCTGIVTIQNNLFGALTCSGSTAAVSGSVNGINISGIASSLSILNNTIGNTTANNIRGGTSGLTTGSSLVAGIILNSNPTSVNITGNQIQNLSSFGTGTTGYVRGIQTPAVVSTSNVYTITNNTISNLATNSASVSIANGTASAAGICFSGGTSNSNIFSNTIFNISNTNTGAIATYVAGISHGNSTNTSIFKNRIYGLTNAGTSTAATTPSVAVGIIVRSGTTAVNIYNNMISIGNAQTTNTVFGGIIGNHGATPDPVDNIYFNSINIQGTVTAGAQPSFGIARTDFGTTARTVTMNIKNNIVTNTRTGGTGNHYAIANNYGAVVASATGWQPNASNNNVLNANAATIGLWTNPLTFSLWQQASSCDGLSLSGISVPYTNATTADLHLSFGVTPTSIESGGTTVAGISDDYDSQIRPGPTGSVNGGAVAPDMGADEIDAVPLDVFPPTINYTVLSNSTCTSSRNLVATITDNFGINAVVGTRPRVYYKKATDNDTYAGNTSAINGWKYVEASNAASPFNFTIDYSIINGGSVVVGDVIQYFVVAQDLFTPPNVGATNGVAFTTTPSSAALTAAAFPIVGTTSAYTIVSGLSTTLTVGATGDYPSITGVGGLFEAINGNGLVGNTTVNILDASVSETGTVTLNPIQSGDCSSTTYTLIIKPASGVNTTLTGSIVGALVRILSSNVSIDGSNNGTTSRNLTITNTSTSTPTVILFGSTGTNPISNTKIKNTIVINGAQTATAIVVSDGTTLGSAGYFNNITIQNNDIRQAYIGSYSIAVPQSGNGSGLTIRDNVLNSTGAAAVRLIGIYVQGVEGCIVSNNTIGNFESAAAETDRGIWIANGTINSNISNNTITGLACNIASFAPTAINITPSSSTANIIVNANIIDNISSISGNIGISANGINLGGASGNVNITKNKITNIKNTGTWGANGILLNSSLTNANVNINNNFVADVSAGGFASNGVDDNGYGIGVNAGGGYNIDFNSINLFTNQTTAAALPACINITSGITTASSINIRNNIFNMAQTGGSTQRYAIYSSAASTVYNTIDYNDYYSLGPNLANIAATDRVNLAAIQAGFGGNVNSKNLLPIFTTATDLHLTSANCQLDGAATPLGSVGTDIDNNVRDAVVPDIGADEFISSSNTLYSTLNTTVVDTRVVSPLGTNFYSTNCELIARVLPSGGNPVSGSIVASTYIDNTVLPTYNAEPYLQRHFDITPVLPSATKTATITLYFLQSEFDTYNANNGIWPDLPTGPADAVGISLLKITQYHGSPTPPGGWPANPSLPNQYSAGTGVYIDPNDANIVWNAVANRWEVTFDVTGFSGFYVHTNLRFALPVEVNYLRGTKQGNGNNLTWKVTCNTSPTAKMTLERSGNGINFATNGLTTITADAARCNQPFDYVDANPLRGMNYYRIKIVDANGKVTYSNTIAMLNEKSGSKVIGIVPNPVANGVNAIVNIASAEQGLVNITISDVMGRKVSTQNGRIIAGSNQLPLQTTNLSSGTYNATVLFANGTSETVRFVKQ